MIRINEEMEFKNIKNGVNLRKSLAKNISA